MGLRDKTKGWAHGAWHHLVAYFMHYLAALTIGLIIAYIKSVRDSADLAYYLKTPREWITPSIIAALFVGFCILGWRSWRYRRELAELRRNETVLAGFGVRAFSAHDTADAKQADWSLIEQDLKAASENQSPLRLLGATGKRTFSATDAPLHNAVCEYQGPIQVLLVRPGSPGFALRVEHIGANADQYADEILDTIEFCRSLHRRGHNIEVRLYDSMPIWKMLATPQVLWLQHYAHAKHVDDTPAYGFASRGSRPTILDGFRCVFEKRWAHDGSHAVDLKRFDRSQWETLAR